MKSYYLYINLMISYFLFVAGSCSEEPEISGCTDSAACNYNIEATILDGSCITPQENFDCFGNCTVQTDDGCECSVLYDECGFCGGDNSSCTDCNEDLNGLAVIDGCENCVGGNTGLESCPSDCMGIDGGTAWINPCGKCVVENDTSCIQGCDGFWNDDGFETVIDECGICGGNNSICTDCNGIINGHSFLDECGNCISNEISWLIQIIASTLPYNNPEIDEVKDVENYLGGDSNATDGFDGIEIDKIDAMINPPGNWVTFYFIHDDWYDAIAPNCDPYCDKFKEDIRTNLHSDYFEGKTWKGELVSNVNGMASLNINYLTNITDADILVSIDGDIIYNVNSNKPIENIILLANQTQEISIQISNLCY